MYPRPVLAIEYCRCLRLSDHLCVNHLLVRTITQNLFQLGSLNLDQRCQTPWLRSLCFCFFVGFFIGGGGGNRSWPSRSNLTRKSKFVPFWACPHHNSSPILARITKFGPEVQNIWVKIPIILGGLNPLHVYWSRQPRVFWRLTSLLFFCFDYSLIANVIKVKWHTINVWFC